MESWSSRESNWNCGVDRTLSGSNGRRWFSNSNDKAIEAVDVSITRPPDPLPASASQVPLLRECIPLLLRAPVKFGLCVCVGGGGGGGGGGGSVTKAPIRLLEL